ncbi:WD repeat-containing protein 4 [Perkinsus olseni]|uniref:WD repeat-containing protein 4 n=1 Tax=Perkinsus olseni TaxID=32597 RepID=A0A7J6M420_PEROL|nr:WD repeat-containing protein 4 [Perkinsus olseni]
MADVGEAATSAAQHPSLMQCESPAMSSGEVVVWAVGKNVFRYATNTRRGKMVDGEHTDAVRAIAHSNRGLWATVGDDKQVVLWDDDFEQVVARYTHRKKITTAVFDPDGRLIIADKYGEVWRLTPVETTSQTGQRQIEFAQAPPNSMEPEAQGCAELLFGHLAVVTAMECVQTHGYLLTADRDEKIRMSLYPSYQVIHAFMLGHTEYVSGLHYSSQYEQVISTSADGTIRRWSLSTGQQVGASFHVDPTNKRAVIACSAYDYTCDKIYYVCENNPTVVVTLGLPGAPETGAELTVCPLDTGRPIQSLCLVGSLLLCVDRVTGSLFQATSGRILFQPDAALVGSDASLSMVSYYKHTSVAVDAMDKATGGEQQQQQSTGDENTNDLLSDGVLNKYGEVKDLRFGRGRGASGDVMYVDYFTWKSAELAVKNFNGKMSFGTDRRLMSCHFTPTTEEMIRVIKDDLRQKRKMKLEKANAAAAESQAKRRNVLRQMLGVSKNAEGQEDTQLPMEAAAIGNYVTCEKAPDGHTYTILWEVPHRLFDGVGALPKTRSDGGEALPRAPEAPCNATVQDINQIHICSCDTPAGGNAVQTAGSESSSSEGGWEEANAFSKTSHFDAWEVGSSAMSSNHRPSCSSVMSPSRQSSVAYSDTDALEVDDIGHPLNTPSPYWIPKGHAAAPTTAVAAKDSGRSEKLMEFLVAVSAVRITGLDRAGDYCLRLEWGNGGRHRYQTKVCRHTDQPEWPEVVLRFRWTTSSLQDRSFVLKLIRVNDDDMLLSRRGSAVSSIMSGVLNDITEQRESPEDGRQHPPARKRMTVGSCCIAIEDIATGPVHHDMALVSEGYCSKAARVEMNISVDQMCDMQIYPIACLFEQNSNINFVFSGRTSESVADSQERSRSHTNSDLAGGSGVVGLPTSLDSAVFGTHDTADLQRFEWKVSFVINNGERSKESSFPACWSEMCTDPLWDAVDETRLDKVLQQHVSEDGDDLAHTASPEDGKGPDMSWITRMISEKLRETNEIVSSSNSSSGASNTATCTAGNENSADDEITDMVTMAKKLVDDEDGATGRADHSNGCAVTGRTLTQTLRESLRDLVTSDDIQQAALGLLSQHHLERLGQLSRKGCSIAPVSVSRFDVRVVAMQASATEILCSSLEVGDC